MKVPFCDLGAQHKEIKTQINKAIKRTIKRSDFILGLDELAFEKEFAKYCGSEFCVGLSSGTAALFLSLLCSDIGEGDEVIVPDFTYIATALAVSYTGARPVFVDIEEDSYNINIASLEKAVTKRTKAVIPVHLYGQPVKMPQILKIAKVYGLKVIEDAAQAHGASMRLSDGQWVKCGSLGDVGCFSFYPTKNLGALGDGGAVTTNSDEIYRKLLMLRDYGRISKYEHAIIGYNSRLDTLQAAILREKLKKIDAWNKMRQEAAFYYNLRFKDVPSVITPSSEDGVKHVYHVYAIRTNKRERVYNCLRDKGIGAIIHYPIPLHLQPAYRSLGYKEGDFPVSEKTAKEIISLPIFPHLSKKQIRYVCDCIKKAVKA